MQRRALLVSSLAPWCLRANAGNAISGEWWPYHPDFAARIDPVITGQFPLAGKTAPRPASVPGGSLLPPKAYDLTGRQFNIDPWLIYGVALQESKMKFGERTLPYPWTLCVAGSAKRFGSYLAALSALRGYVTEQGIRNVDCGAMQVNWRWHNDKLQSFERALDPYPNLAVGAQILREHFDRLGSWSRAVALYHTGSDANAETVSRGRRYADGVISQLERLGVNASALMVSTGWRRYGA